MEQFQKQIYEMVESKKMKSVINKIYNTSLTIVIFLSMISLCTKKEYPAFATIEWVAASFFLVDYLFR